MHPQNRRRPKLGGLKQIRPWNNSYKINSKGTGQEQTIKSEDTQKQRTARPWNNSYKINSKGTGQEQTIKSEDTQKQRTAKKS